MAPSTDKRRVVSAVKLALMAKHMRAQAEMVLRADPIAIIGMGCRVPGGGDSPAQLWKLLCAGVDAISEIPPDRWDANAWYDPDPSASAKSTTKWGGFLERIDAFDAEYFGILPREAERMDPQQRLLLEVAIEAIDDAGLPHERLRGSRTGVYIASYHNDYAQLQHDDVEGIELRTLTGTLHSVLANRLSYFLDLRGPSISIDTACSSSLVAIHMACQSLRFGEVDAAVAGGVSVIIRPEPTVSMSKIGFMSPVGRCKTFDAQADGFVRGEGCGVVVLKRLSDAIADNDRILAVIRGSAVNQDGHSTLLTAPNGPAQVALIRESLASAQVDPDRIGYFEAHGTGTILGDPIEVEAIAETVGLRSPEFSPCLIGSIKANIGHLEAAAGVAGLIKAVLALRHEAVPPQVNFSELNPNISLAGTRLGVPTVLTPWPAGPLPRAAAVSAFGIGGTNANVILEETPKIARVSTDENAERAHVLTLSAHNHAALQALVHSWIGFLTETPASVADLCYTASLRRSHYNHRVALVGRSKEGLRDRLQEYLNQATVPDAAPVQCSPSKVTRVGFVFSGQGPQWHAMGRELLAEESVFRDVVNRCDALLHPLSGWSLLDELGQTEEDSRLDQTEVAQPALFALQIALVALWRSWGVTPDALVGHSVGEIAALHTAGVLELDEAIRVVWHRGRIMQQATGIGRMASTGLTEAEARELTEPYGDLLSVGAVNGPRSVVLSGEAAALEAALAKLTAYGISHRALPVQYAFHSAQMAQFGDQLVAQLGALRSGSPTIATYSTVTGRLAENTHFDSKYFGRNLREPVRFADAIKAMLGDGCDVVIEVGPQPVLAGSIAECSAEVGCVPTSLASLRRGRPERETALQACAGAFVAGCNLAWERVQPRLGQIVDLPLYPWQRKRYWLRNSSLTSAAHPMRRSDSDGEPAATEGRDGDGLLYEIAWQRASALHPPEHSSAEGSWLLFADRGGTADALAARIETARGTCCRVLAGNTFEQISERDWIINPAEPKHFDRLLAQDAWKNGTALRGVVHCWSLDIGMMEGSVPAANWAPELLGPGSVLHLTQALAKMTAIVDGSLWLVTRGTQVVNGLEPTNELCPRGASLWGLANVITIEMASLATHVIDLDAGNGKLSDATALFTELAIGQDARIALRGGERWAPRLQIYHHPVQVANSLCTAAATYWITGGLGTLGCETARWLVRRGAKHLVLSGRRPPNTSAASCIRELEELGVTIRVFQADAASRDRMQFVYDQIQNGMPPLRGVIHAAGAVRDAVLTNQRWEDATEIFGGKVCGAWVLHDLTRALPLEFFILYSSAAVVLGAGGQGLYSAANAELDALANFRRRLGLPALSVAWGPWAGAGMAADRAARARDVWQTRGLGKIEPASGFAQLERIVAEQAAYAAVIPIDWHRFLIQLPPHVDRDFFSAVVPSAEMSTTTARSAQDGIIERLRDLPPSQRRAALTAHLTERALQALGLAATTPLELRVPLKEFGLDSLMAVELRNSLAHSGGRALPATLLFDYPTLDSLTTYLAHVWLLEDETHSGNGQQVADVSASGIVELSEKDAEELLLRELELNDVERRA